jgi:hypothetical protein
MHIDIKIYEFKDKTSIKDRDKKKKPTKYVVTFLEAPADFLRFITQDEAVVEMRLDVYLWNFEQGLSCVITFQLVCAPKWRFHL